MLIFTVVYMLRTISNKLVNIFKIFNATNWANVINCMSYIVYHWLWYSQWYTFYRDRLLSHSLNCALFFYLRANHIDSLFNQYHHRLVSPRMLSLSSTRSVLDDLLLSVILSTDSSYRTIKLSTSSTSPPATLPEEQSSFMSLP